MELTHLKVFLTVADKGNLSAAAKELNTTQPNLGRQMTALSKEVGIELFTRHSRGVELTAQGRDFLELCQNIIGQLEQGTIVIREKESELKGTLKVMTGSGTLDRILENIPTFTKNYPNLRISFPIVVNLLTINSVELQIGNVDVGIFPFKFSNTDLVQHHLFDMSLRIYASPSYLQSVPKSKTLEDLKGHRIIAYTGENQNLFNGQLMSKSTQQFYEQPFFEVNNGPSMRKALVSGLGMGCYGYDSDLLENNLLVDVFPDMPDQKFPYYFTYHKRLEGLPKIRVFHEFIKEIINRSALISI